MKGLSIGLALLALIALASNRRAVSIRLTEDQKAAFRSRLRADWDRVAVNGTIDRMQLEALILAHTGNAAEAAALAQRIVTRIDSDANGRITWAEMAAAAEQVLAD